MLCSIKYIIDKLTTRIVLQPSFFILHSIMDSFSCLIGLLYLIHRLYCVPLYEYIITYLTTYLTTFTDGYYIAIKNKPAFDIIVCKFPFLFFG